MSTVAGMVDTASFITLAGIFVAHLTGNMIVMGSDLAAGRLELLLPRLLVLVFFVLGVVVARLLCADAAPGAGPHRVPTWALRRLLWMEVLMLATFIAAGAILVDRRSGPIDIWLLLVVAVPGVVAMAAQATRWKLEGGPATQVMTGNVTAATLDMVELVRHARRGTPVSVDARRTAWGGALAVASFLVGALLAGAMLPLMGYLSLLVPLAVLLILALLAGGRDVERKAPMSPPTSG